MINIHYDMTLIFLVIVLTICTILNSCANYLTSTGDLEKNYLLNNSVTGAQIGMGVILFLVSILSIGIIISRIRSAYKNYPAPTSFDILIGFSLLFVVVSIFVFSMFYLAVPSMRLNCINNGTSCGEKSYKGTPLDPEVVKKEYIESIRNL